MTRQRPRRLAHIAGIGVDSIGAQADASGADLLRLENLDVDIPPDPVAIQRTAAAAAVIPSGGAAGMAERTVTVGSSAKELRMIGWRVGWIVAPEALLPDLVAVSLLLDELDGLPVGVPAGGWSLLFRVADFGLDGAAMSESLPEQGIAATGWQAGERCMAGSTSASSSRTSRWSA